MSSIDQYNHRLLGFIKCPSSLDFVDNNATRDIAVYELLEDIPSDETYFDGKKGDIIVGGGSGEAPALRISMPECSNYFILKKEDKSGSGKKLFKSFWTPTQREILCEGFKKTGWNTETPIESWLAENVCKTMNGNEHTPLQWTNITDTSL